MGRLAEVWRGADVGLELLGVTGEEGGEEWAEEEAEAEAPTQAGWVLEEEEGGDVEVAVDSILHMLLAKHGAEAFTWEVVDQSTSRDRLEARVWSARQEVHHIKSRGGALRSWDKPVEHGQTLNLCEPPRPRSIDVDANQRAAAKAAEASEVGTNARALAAWQVVVAGSSIGWIKLLDALRRFYAREGHARVPAFHVEGTYRLGEVLRGVRTRNDFVADCPERRVVLEEMGVVWQVNYASNQPRRVPASAASCRLQHPPPIRGSATTTRNSNPIDSQFPITISRQSLNRRRTRHGMTFWEHSKVSWRARSTVASPCGTRRRATASGAK